MDDVMWKWLLSSKYNREFILTFVNVNTGERIWFYQCQEDDVYNDGYYLRLTHLSKHKPVTRKTDTDGSIYTKPYWHPQLLIERMAVEGYE